MVEKPSGQLVKNALAVSLQLSCLEARRLREPQTFSASGASQTDPFCLDGGEEQTGGRTSLKAGFEAVVFSTDISARLKTHVQAGSKNVIGKMI